MAEIDELAHAMGYEILDGVKKAFATKWDGLPDSEKALVFTLAKRYAKLVFQQKMGLDVQANLEIIGSALNDLKVAGKIELRDAFLEGAEIAFKLLGAFGGALIKSALK